PVYNNLAYYDPFKSRESLETIIPELAESWRWGAGNTALIFTLRRGVRWHDGKPFTSEDVKTTFDIVRGASTRRTKLNPRKAWYANVSEIAVNGDHEVTFHLKRPQPALLAMLAAGFSPVMAAHVPVAEWRIKPMGTGPFRFREYKRDQFIALEKNPTYWAPGRPYLDGVVFHIISNLSSRIAAYKAGQIDIDQSADTLLPVMEAIKTSGANIEFIETTSMVSPAITFNTKKPPFDDARMRQVVNLALDRNALIRGALQNGAVEGGLNLPPPAGVWGLSKEQLATVPSHGDLGKRREEARRLMRELGYGPDKPYRTDLVVSILRNNPEMAVWTASQLKDVWIEATVKQIETGVFYGVVARREFTLLFNPIGIGVDDPDVNYYENYSCGSQRNYSDYCNPEVQAMIDRESQMLDADQRRALVQEIERRLLSDGARNILAWLKVYNARAPYVRNYIPHQSLYNFLRLQEVWLDK
ncbi:MAG: ABC transporter substrate-binding protein, partial [Candidatus Lambdaproteobacteria bacterium]|nr:ABC transporter substrate-binding protein [Candidatus Lambdaproteobacteria bacterium]